MEGLAGTAGDPGVNIDPSELFAQFFSGGGFQFGFSGMAEPRQGKNSTIPYEVSLEDLYNGKNVKMNMEKEVVCGVCQGSALHLAALLYVLKSSFSTGAKGKAKAKPCVKCEGKGWTRSTTAVSMT